MKYLMLLLLLVGCNSEVTPKFNVGDCTFSNKEFADEDGTRPERILKVGKEKYLYQFGNSKILINSYPIRLQKFYKKVDDSICTERGY